MNFEERFAELPQYSPKLASTHLPDDHDEWNSEDTSSHTNKPSVNDEPRSDSLKTSHDNLSALAEVAAGTSGGNDGSLGNGLKRNMDHKRNLVQQFLQNHGLFPTEKETNDFLQQHIHVFPSKSNLQVKIREVRQKYMQR